VRGFLESDPVGNAFVVNWAFHQRDRDVYADSLPPRAVLTASHGLPPMMFRFCGLSATDAKAADFVLSGPAPGPAFLFISDLGLLEAVRSRANVVHVRSAWLYRLDREGYVDVQEHEVRPVPVSFAPMIANLWEPEWEAAPYIRSRLESSPSVGIFEDDQLVAWYGTHIVTDKVTVMGFLHVLDEYRHRGYARSLSCALSKEIFRSGRIPACHVYVDNEASLRLMDSLGLRRVKQQAFVEVEFRGTLKGGD
jgi:ribosomal protein S18 acetylase RimI-like enzyme